MCLTFITCLYFKEFANKIRKWLSLIFIFIFNDSVFLLSSQNITLMRSNFMACCQPFEKMSCFCRKIRPCPSTNPGCVSTNPKSSSFAFPWTIPENSSDNAIQVLKIYAFTYSHFCFFWINL